MVSVVAMITVGSGAVVIVALTGALRTVFPFGLDDDGDEMARAA